MPELKLCEACAMEFDWTGVAREGAEYCCEGCASGGECTCPEHNHQYETAQALPSAAANQLGLRQEEAG